MTPAQAAARSGYVIMGVSGCGKSLIGRAPDAMVAQLIRQINDRGGSRSAYLPDPARQSGGA